MVLLLAIAISLLIGFLSGGTLKNISGLRIRYLPLLIAALLVQVAIFSSILGTRDFIYDYGPYIYIGTLAMSLFVMLMNMQIPGMPVIALGAFLNAVVITANGGYMPSPRSALIEADRLQHVQVDEQKKADNEWVLSNSTVADDDTRLRFLGDVIPIPDSVPFANVISIGDIILAIGAGIAIVGVMHRRPDEHEPVSESVSQPVSESDSNL